MQLSSSQLPPSSLPALQIQSNYTEILEATAGFVEATLLSFFRKEEDEEGKAEVGNGRGGAGGRGRARGREGRKEVEGRGRERRKEEAGMRKTEGVRGGTCSLEAEVDMGG